MDVNSPSKVALKAVLGPAGVLWSGIIRAVEEMFVPLDQQWKPSKAGFGRVCLLQHKKRTLLYITPDKEKVWMAIVLGERACGLPMARPHAEGRGIRFPVSSLSDVSTIKKLLEIKATPK